MKKISRWVLAGAVALVVACGGNSSPSPQPTPTPTPSNNACTMTCTSGLWRVKTGTECPASERCYADSVTRDIGGEPCGYASDLAGHCR